MNRQKVQKRNGWGILLWSLILIVCLSGPFSLVFQGSWVRAQSDTLYRQGEVLCKMRPGQDVKVLVQRLGLSVLDQLEANTFRLGLPVGLTVPQALALLNADPSVEWAEPNFLLRLSQLDQRSQAFVDQRSQAFVDGYSPADYFDQYAARLLRLARAHEITRGGGITVAVIDTGIDPMHPVFTTLAEGYDFVDQDRAPTEQGNGCLLYTSDAADE